MLKSTTLFLSAIAMVIVTGGAISLENLEENYKRTIAGPHVEVKAENNKPSKATSKVITQKGVFADCQKRRPTIDCSKASKKFRSIDGLCNNVNHPEWGATKTPVKRLTKALYADGVATARGFPNTPVIPTANQVSKAAFTVEQKSMSNSEGFAVSFMAFAQFVDHDMTDVEMQVCKYKKYGSCDNIAESFKYPCLPILFNNNNLNDNSKKDCTPFHQSVSMCKIDENNVDEVREVPNRVSSFLDGSQIYGAEADLADALRSTEDRAKMNLTCDGLLPVMLIPGVSACSFLQNIDGLKKRSTCRVLGGCSFVGDPRGDDNIPLHTMHTLWLRNHNKIVDGLRAQNPNMYTHEALYQTARKINTGIWAHLAFDEYLPDLVKLPVYTEYKANTDPSIINAFNTAAFRYGHSLVPNSFDQNDNAFNRLADPISLQDALNNREPINYRGIEPIWFGLTGNKSARVDYKFADGIARKLFVRPQEKLYRDLLAINIQRGRDHGLQTYGHYRKLCKLPPLNSWKEAEDKKVFFKAAREGLQRIFKHPNDVDLYAAGVSEIHATGSELGPTFQCLVKKQFLAIRDGDRFFWRNPKVFKEDQRKAIEAVSFASILCDNLNGIVSIQPKALRVPNTVDNQRTECGNIKKLDLSKWKID
eukprot:TCONS_00071582-protein